MSKEIDPKYAIDRKSASKEEIDEALALLAKKRERQDKVKSGVIKGGKSWSEMTDEQKQKSREYNKKRLQKQALLAKKAAEAGITVSDEEVAKAFA